MSLHEGKGDADAELRIVTSYNGVLDRIPFREFMGEVGCVNADA